MSKQPMSGIPCVATASELASAAGVEIAAFSWAQRAYGPVPTIVRGRTRYFDRIAQVLALDAVITSSSSAQHFSEHVVLRADNLLHLVACDFADELKTDSVKANVREAAQAHVLNWKREEILARYEADIRATTNKYLADLRRRAKAWSTRSAVDVEKRRDQRARSAESYANHELSGTEMLTEKLWTHQSLIEATDAAKAAQDKKSK